MFKIFVGNLDYKVRVEQVRELFAIYAPIEDLVIPLDPKTNRSRGFAIVMIRDPELGAAAIRGVQGRRLLGRELVVNEAKKKKGKADAAETPPARNGPFGPRMFRSSDSRGRGSRNPRRGTGGGSSRGSGPEVGGQGRVGTPASTRGPGTVSQVPVGPRPPQASGRSPTPGSGVPFPGPQSAAAPHPAAPQAKPKHSPSSPPDGAA